MNIGSLNLFRSSQDATVNQQFVVIGLGRFGRAVCSTLHGLRYEVLAIDRDEKLVDRAIADRVADHAVRLDSTEPSALKEAGVFEFDTAIVAIGNYLAESIVTTLNLKEGGVSQVVAKASSATHVKLLKKVGADRVVFPEREMGCELARSLTRPRILDRFELDPEHSIVETIVPERFAGKTLVGSNIRQQYRISVLAVGDDETKFDINPDPLHQLHAGELMVILGSNEDIDRFTNC
ncbi:MAG: potassium channel family protein [Geitlerinemataceae cyanobacterium]